MHDHDTTHHTKQTSGSTVSSSRPGPPGVKPYIAVGLFEEPKQELRFPELLLLLCKVVLLVLSLWCEYCSRLIKPTDVSLPPPPCVFNPRLPSLLRQLASSVPVSALAIVPLVSEFQSVSNQPTWYRLNPD